MSCILQYNGAYNATGYVYFGPTAPTVTTSSFVLAKGAFQNCDTSNFTEDQAGVWISSTNTGDNWTLKVK